MNEEYTKELIGKNPDELPFAGRVALFQLIRKRIHDLSEELDFSGSNFTYNLKNEAEIRKRVSELSQLARKLEICLGPEVQPTNIT